MNCTAPTPLISSQPCYRRLRGKRPIVWRMVQGSNLRHLSVLRDSSPLPRLSANHPGCCGGRSSNRTINLAVGPVFETGCTSLRPTFQILSVMSKRHPPARTEGAAENEQRNCPTADVAMLGLGGAQAVMQPSTLAQSIVTIDLMSSDYIGC